MKYFFLLLLFSLLGCGTPSEPNPPFRESVVFEESVVTMTTEESMLVDRHNQARQERFIGSDLRWSPTLVESAQSYADYLASSGIFGHDRSNIGIYGENLYAASYRADYEDAINAWLNEEPYYNYERNSCQSGRKCGHYTQIIWEKSTEVGCAMAIYERGAKKGWTLVVCRYNPPGNYIGQLPY